MSGVRRRWCGCAAGLWLALAAGGAAAQGFGTDFGAGDRRPVSIEADKGIEWHQNERAYVARGNVRVKRANVTIYCDVMTAFYRPIGQSAPPQPSQSGPMQSGSTEIYRVVAEGNVRIATETQTVYGDKATYDLDQALVVVTGRDLKLVTPRDIVTARDSLEWYDQKQIAVARGDAVAIREEKRVRADVLVAQVVKAPDGASRLSRVDAHGNVVVSTQNEIARGAAGVYNVDTGLATLSGNVTITRGDNEVRGQYGVVDLNNNVSRILSGPPDAVARAPAGRVQGLIVPGSKSPAQQQQQQKPQ